MRLKEAMEDSIRHGMIVKHDPDRHDGCMYHFAKLTIINPRNGKKAVSSISSISNSCSHWYIKDADDKRIKGPVYSCSVFEDLCKP